MNKHLPLPLPRPHTGAHGGPSVLRVATAILWEQFHRRSTYILAVLGLILTSVNTCIDLYIYYMYDPEKTAQLWSLDFAKNLSAIDSSSSGFIIFIAPLLIILIAQKYTSGIAALQHVAFGGKQVFIFAHYIVGLCITFLWSIVATCIVCIVASTALHEQLHLLEIPQLWVRITIPLVTLALICIGLSYLIQSPIFTSLVWYGVTLFLGSGSLLLSMGGKIKEWGSVFALNLHTLWAGMWNMPKPKEFSNNAFIAISHTQILIVLSLWVVLTTFFGLWKAYKSDVNI